MLTCPHCNRAGIGPWAKFFATPADPAVCRHCDNASSISPGLITVSTLLYFFAGFIAFSFITVYMMKGWPSPAITLGILGLFFVAVESAKVLWVPLQALSDSVVKNKQASANRFYVVVFIIFSCLALLARCGY